jgi:hypothetical protein
MADEQRPIRSYQRIFRPDRRVYQIEGHRLPVPGGVRLAWLGWFTAALLSVLVFAGRSPLLTIVLAGIGLVCGLRAGGAAAGALSGAATAAGVQLAGLVVATLDWPLRLAVAPALAATLLTQATPDGRAAHRYALSRLGLWLRPRRRSLGRALPLAGEPGRLSGELWICPDEHTPALRCARVHGPASVCFSSPRPIVRGRVRPRRWVLVRAPRRGDAWRASVRTRIELGEREVLEVRP